MENKNSTNINLDTIKIDLVYLWVNGNDPKWLEKKAMYKEELATLSLESSSECRYIQNDELKYSLRSVDKFAPWINRIFIITDNQIPEWLDTTNPKIKIIDHTEILPKEILPTFSSPAIELGLANIPELSEHFLYANDDMLIAKEVGPDFFFDKKGNPIVRLCNYNVKKHKKKSDYVMRVFNAMLAIKKDFGKYYYLVPHHNIDAYNKSTFRECLAYYDQWVQETFSSKFRNPKGTQRSIISYYALANNLATLRLASRFSRANSLWKKLMWRLKSKFVCDSRIISVNVFDHDKNFKKHDPTLFCINDNEKSTTSDRIRARDFLDKMFPDKSSFEK